MISENARKYINAHFDKNLDSNIGVTSYIMSHRVPIVRVRPTG